MSTNFSNDSFSRENCESAADSSPLKIFKVIFLSIILISSLVGNVLIITVVRKRQELRRTINSFIVNMAVSDIIIPILLIPISLMASATNSLQWPISGKSGLISCKLSTFLVAVSITVSVQSLLWIALDRFVAVVLPLKAHLISSRFRAFAIASTWIVAVIINSTDLYTTKLVEDGGNFYCIREEKISLLLKIIGYGRVVLVSFAPILGITVLYSVIAVTLRRQNESLRCTAVKENDQRKRQAIKMSLCIIILFNLCVLPYTIMTMTYLSGTMSCSVYGVLGFLSIFGIYLSCTVNPLICFIFVENYRRGLRGIISSCPGTGERGATPNIERRGNIEEIDLPVIELKKLKKTSELP